jgi:uncharacterized protein (DUF2235 family)
MAREFANRISEKYPDAQIRFLGLFDTVAQFGLADPVNSNPGINLNIPKNVQYTAHAVAKGEYRGAFPLTSIVKGRQGYNTSKGYKEQKGSNFWEKPFAGVHSEVGGGYRKDGGQNNVNLKSLRWMISTAQGQGVPLDSVDAEQHIKASNYVHNPGYHDSRYPIVDQVKIPWTNIGIGRKFRRVYQGNLNPKK